jgi:hypothetical protein
MAHAQRPDFVFRLNGRVHLNRRGGRGVSVQSTTDRRDVHISLQRLYCSCKPVFCSHVTLIGYPHHSTVSPSLLLPCVAVCHHISNAVYLLTVELEFGRTGVQTVRVDTRPAIWANSCTAVRVTPTDVWHSATIIPLNMETNFRDRTKALLTANLVNSSARCVPLCQYQHLKKLSDFAETRHWYAK